MPAVIVPAAISLIQMGIGAANKSAAKKEAARLEANRPKIGISPETTDELNLAESELQQGLSARAERAYIMQEDKGLTNSLAAILSGGGNLNNVGELYGNADEGRQRLTMLNENARLVRINNLVAAQRNATGKQEQQFEFNQWMPWADKTQANAAARLGADAQISSGLQTLGSTAMQYTQNEQEQKMFEKYLNYQNGNPNWKNNTVNPNATNYRFGGTPGNSQYEGQDFYQYSPNSNSNFNTFG